VSERARSFETAAAEYERYRPEYPAEAIRWAADRLGLAAGARVLDLGAGTGKLTRGLAALGYDVVAVEPGAPMLEQLRASVPGVEALEGAAEAIPLSDASVDAVAAGQAYHWFDPPRALPELRRVLRPGGGMALFWNWWDLRDPLQRKLLEIIRGGVPGFEHEPPDRDVFEPVAETVVESILFASPETLAARVATTSAFLTAEPERGAERLEQVRRLAAERGDGFDLPQLTYVFAYRLLS
jgi:SAM-dependent methyltransferase